MGDFMLIRAVFGHFRCFLSEKGLLYFLFTIFADCREFVDYGNGAKQPD